MQFYVKHAILILHTFEFPIFASLVKFIKVKKFFIGGLQYEEKSEQGNITERHCSIAEK